MVYLKYFLPAGHGRITRRRHGQCSMCRAIVDRQLRVSRGHQAIDQTEVNKEIAKYVDVMIGNEEDFTACLGFEIEGNDENLKELNLDGYKKMINHAAQVYPNFKNPPASPWRLPYSHGRSIPLPRGCQSLAL